MKGVSPDFGRSCTEDEDKQSRPGADILCGRPFRLALR